MHSLGIAPSNRAVSNPPPRPYHARARRDGPAAHGGTALEAHFTRIDWAVLVGYLLLTTWLGARLAGKQSTIREFFLAGRKMPWLAVAGSNIATEISAVTLIAVPAAVFKIGGDLSYLQLGLGAILARVIIAIWFVPAFYEREIFSPYDYMGHWLGQPVRAVTSGLFVLGAVLGQSVRVLLTAVILQLITGIPLEASIWLIGGVAVVWTLLGGITTVIWTDVIQFFVFLIGIIAALLFVLWQLPGGWAELIAQAAAAPDGSKLRFWNLSPNPHEPFTIWTALIANTLLCLAVYGTDQIMAQRMFCCRGPRQAALATIFSCVALVVTVLAAFVGLGLYAFYQRFPMEGAAAAAVAADKESIFPVFVLTQMPAGLVGLIIAGVFAAAISTLDGVLVALSQVVVTGLVRPWRARVAAAAGRSPPDFDRRDLVLSKVLVVVWAVTLCGMAHVSQLALAHHRTLLDLALSMATYTGGPLLAAFMLAFLRLDVDYRGILWAAPLSVLMVFAITWHQTWAHWTTCVLAGAIVLAWLGMVFASISYWATEWWRDARPTLLLIATAGLAVFLNTTPLPGLGAGGAKAYLTLAWPWNVPIGFTVAFVLGYALARPRPNRKP